MKYSFKIFITFLSLQTENNEWYLCQHKNKRSAHCSNIFEDSNSASNESDEETQVKRGLPFETLNYGRRSVMKRSYPFLKNGIYGRRSQLRSLPFDTLSYGKRGLPFETLNYGKRAYIPIDGYIMGKREE